MTNLSERLIAEGLAKVTHRGVEGTLRTLIEVKYGQIPDWADERLAHATDDQLDQWVKSIFSADTIEDLLGEHD